MALFIGSEPELADGEVADRRAPRPPLVALALVFVALLSLQARADDLVVFSAAAVKEPLAPVPDWLLKASGDQVRFTFGTAGAMHDKALASPFDIVIVPPATLADLVTRGAVVAGSRTDLGIVHLAAAVRSGTPVPDITSLDALKTSLLNASSIGLADPATGATTGIYFAKLMQTIGIAAAIAPKVKLYPDGGSAAEAAARGEVALVLGQKSEIMPVRGLQLVGLLPEAVQLNTTYSAGLASASANKKSARDLLSLLTSPEAQASLTQNGFDLPR